MPATRDLLTETLLIAFPLSEYKPWLLAEFISVLIRQASVKHQNISYLRETLLPSENWDLGKRQVITLCAPSRGRNMTDFLRVHI